MAEGESYFSEYVTILGTRYLILVRTRDDDDYELKRGGVQGYCDFQLKRIVIRDRLKDKEERSEDNKKCILGWMKKTLRHEIVHAFLSESGLDHQTKIHDSWAKNEEMVDWIALQGSKIYSAWAEANALENQDLIKRSNGSPYQVQEDITAHIQVP